MADRHDSDQQLIDAALRGEHKAVNTLYDNYFPRISAFIQANSGDEDDARDIFQEAVMALYQRAQKGDFVLSSSLYTYLYAVCRNLWFKKLRKKPQEGVTLSEDLVSNEEESLMEAANENQQYELFKRKFLELGERCREMLALFFKGMSSLEVQEAMGLASEQFVRKRKFECKKRLTELIQQDPSYKELAFK
ncbi:MAG: sigma-70 family RNA polymerase sigma factor [Bacteroidia bacterium]|nr:sigma-70 family RNA polymerase sigma factor [Bacteroidia bacterium]